MTTQSPFLFSSVFSSMNLMKLLKNISYLFAIIGLGRLSGATYNYTSTKTFVTGATRADGQVER